MEDQAERDLKKIRALLKLSQGALRLSCLENVEADRVIARLRSEVAALSDRTRTMEDALRQAAVVGEAIAAMASENWPYAPIYMPRREVPGRIVDEAVVRRICAEGAELRRCLEALAASSTGGEQPGASPDAVAAGQPVDSVE
jgi:hypothetical protein